MTLNDVYKPLFTSEKNYFLITGGRGSGKSFAVNTWVLLLTYERGHVILFTRYTMVSAEISIIPEFKEKIDLLGVASDFIIKRDHIINRKTGSSIIFKGIKQGSGNQDANLKSLAGVTTWILDEARELEDESKFDDIDLSIRSLFAQNRTVLILNPTTREHWIYKRWMEGTNEFIEIEGHKIPISNHEAVQHIHTTYLDNIDNLSPKFLAVIQDIKQNNPEKYRHKILGGWIDRPEGAIFDNWSIGNCPEELPFIYGMDFGYKQDPTTLVKVAVSNENLFTEEILYKVGMKTPEIINFLNENIDKNSLIVADSAEPRLIDEIYEAGFNIINAKKGPDSVRHGIQKMLDYNIVTTKKSQNIITELNNYAWHDTKSNTPKDAYNHAIDAIRYALEDIVLYGI